jgi:subtilase family serine protease
VAANASVNSGYPFILNGGSALANGTSASAPLWAGWVAKEQRRNRAPYGALVRGVRVRHG